MEIMHIYKELRPHLKQIAEKQNLPESRLRKGYPAVCANLAYSACLGAHSGAKGGTKSSGKKRRDKK